MNETKYIFKVQHGLLVRKAVGHTIHQRYFGYKRFAGGETEALEAAIAYRDQLLDQAAAKTQGKSTASPDAVCTVRHLS